MTHYSEKLDLYLFILLSIIVFGTIIVNFPFVYNSIILSKYLFFNILVPFVLFWMMLSIPSKKLHQIDFNMIDISILLLSIYLMASQYLRGNATNEHHLSFLIVLVAYFFYTYYLKMDHGKGYFQYLISIVLLTSSIQAAIGLFQLWGILPSNHGIFKVTGTFSNPGPYSIYLGVLVPVSINILINKKKRIQILITFFLLFSFHCGLYCFLRINQDLLGFVHLYHHCRYWC
jgi:hypothetical protein